MLVKPSRAVSSYLCKSALIVIKRRSTQGDIEWDKRRAPSTLALSSAVRWKGEPWDAEVFVPKLPAPRSNVDAPVAPLKIFLAGTEDTRTGGHASAPAPDATVELFLAVGHVDVDVASTTPVHLFWTTDDYALYISTDLRWLPDVVTSSIDPAGVYALLKFRSCLPPFTIWRRARRFPPARRTRLDISQQQVVGSTKSQYEWPRLVELSRRGNSWMLEALDSYLDRATKGRRPVVLFSGGVDSSLLAWRLQAMGKRDTVLLHSTRGPSNPETIRARAIASELQLELVEAHFDRTYAFEFLTDITQKLPYPIGSMSLIEMAQICDRVADFGPDAIAIDGTGADGLFGMNATASRIAYLERYPRWGRRLARRLFDAYLWRRPSGFLGRAAALAKRSALASPPATLAIARDQFEDIFYYVDPRVRETVLGETRRWCEFVTSERDSLLLQCRLLDLMSVCAGTFAQKSFAHFANRDEDVIFPFLARGFISTAMGEFHLPSTDGEEKRDLKHLLATRVSPALVYARKYGFQNDVSRYVGDPNVVDLIDNAISTCDRGLRIHLNCERIGRVFRRTRRGQPVPAEHVRIAWNSAVLILWHSQMVKR